jgi:predicted nucleic acid-binding protein
VETTERRVQFLEERATLLVETQQVYDQWRGLLIGHLLTGLAVHDARLVAIMQAYDLTHFLTLNGKDFARYPSVIAISPQDIAAKAR